MWPRGGRVHTRELCMKGLRPGLCLATAERPVGCSGATSEEQRGGPGDAGVGRTEKHLVGEKGPGFCLFCDEDGVTRRTSVTAPSCPFAVLIPPPRQAMPSSHLSSFLDLTHIKSPQLLISKNLSRRDPSSSQLHGPTFCPVHRAPLIHLDLKQPLHLCSLIPLSPLLTPLEGKDHNLM